MLARPEFCSCDQRSGLAETRTILVTPGGHGKTQFAVQAQYLIGAFQSVELVICAGAAGSLAPQLSVGDVVVGTATVEHDYRLMFATRPLPRFPGHRPSIEALRRSARGPQRLPSRFRCDRQR